MYLKRMNQFTHKRVFADIPIYSYEIVSSTQDVAEVWLESQQNNAKSVANQAQEGQIVGVFVADHQFAGKGRRDRIWNSKSGSSLLCTYIIKNGRSAPWLKIARLMVSYVQVLNNLSVETFLKWPNDIVDESGKKLGGCLTEIEGDFLLVGVGINMDSDAYPDELERSACSLENFGVQIDSESYIDSVIETYLKMTAVLEGYKALSHTIGKQIEIEQISQRVSGRAIDIDQDGSLLLEVQEGETQKIFEGDIIHARIKY